MKCFNPSDNNYYAVKIYKRTDQNDNEIDVLQRAAAKYVSGVVDLVEVLTDSKWTYLVMELIDGINLMEYLSTVSLNGATLFSVVESILEIVKSIHTKLQYTHGRICFKNIYYVRHAKELRLIGFGNAKPINGRQDIQNDYWAIGVLIYTILCGHSPFRSSDPVRQVENNQFDVKSKEWSTLPKNTTNYIQQLLCNSKSIGSPSALTLVKSFSFKGRKELLEDNKKIVEIRACKVETKPVIKTEMTHELNGNERITNGHPPNEIVEYVITSVDASDVPRLSTAQESLERTNGPVQKSPSTTTRGSDDKAEPNQYKKKDKKKPSVEAPLISEEPVGRRLRDRKQRNDEIIGRPGTSTVSKVVAIKKEENTPPNDTTKKRGRGRPKQPPQQLERQPEKQAKRPSEEAGLLGIEALSNWVYGWRPIKRLKVTNYCFVRVDYR